MSILLKLDGLTTTFNKLNNVYGKENIHTCTFNTGGIFLTQIFQRYHWLNTPKTNNLVSLRFAIHFGKVSSREFSFHLSYYHIDEVLFSNFHPKSKECKNIQRGTPTKPVIFITVMCRTSLP